jgi:hypothetical protein
VYFDWFHQATLIPPALSGDLKVGGISNAQPRGGEDHINVQANSYDVSFSPITSARFDALADPGFEQKSVGDGQYLGDPTGSPWSFSGDAGISANNSDFTRGSPPAPEGTQVAFMQGLNGVNGSFSQSVSDWTAGTYDLTFEAAQRANFGTSQQAFNVLVDGNVVGHFQPSGTSYQPYTTDPFTISGPGPHTITFQGLNSTGDNTAFIDQVMVSLVYTN